MKKKSKEDQETKEVISYLRSLETNEEERKNFLKKLHKDAEKHNLIDMYKEVK